MSELKIKAAIQHYNDNVRKDGEPRMTQKSLAKIILPNVEEATGQQYIANWNYGVRMGTFQKEHAEGICEATGVDANFLYGIKPMDE